MKSNISLFSRSMVLSMAVMFLMLVATDQVSAQATCSTPTNIANFGVDGDINANTPAAIMGDSWFYSNVFPGTGIGVIGSTAATATPAISSAAFNSIIQSATSPQGRNRTYVQRMSVPYLSQVNGMTLIDAFSARDNISPDSSAFTGSNKNGDNPSIWSIGLTSVPNKNDIIDVGGHLRRQSALRIATGSSLNDLWMYTYVTRLGTGGDAYTDIEIYRTVPYLSPSGQLMNTGPAATGGHTAFTFNNTAGIATPGDIILCVNYNSAGGVASVRIWCDINNLDGNNNGFTWFNAQPGRPFNFTGDFITGTGANGYGYAEIQSLSGASCLIYSVLNATNTPAGEWGNLTSSSAVYDTNIEPAQLVNIAFNFTDMGLDFSSLAGPCYNVFGALWFKTRSSSSYSSELKDACGPYTFGNFSEIQANAGPDKVINCNNAQVTLDGSSATSGAIIFWYTANGNIVSGATTATPVVDAPGTYIMSATNPSLSSCVATDTVIVTNSLSVPVANAGPDKQIICTTPSITLSGSSTTPGVIYSWVAINDGNIVSGANTATPVVNSAGCYVLTVLNPVNGCSQTDTACVSLNLGVPVISGVTQSNVGCFAACTGAISFTTSGGQSPYTYNWSSGATTASLTNLCAGNYTVTVTGTNGCTATASYTITQPAATLSSSITVTQNVSCNAGVNGSATVTGNGGTAPYTYLWNNGATTASVSGLAAGPYTVTVTDQNGCTAQANATVTQPSNAVSVTLFVSPHVFCYGGNNGVIYSTPAGGTSPYTYLWNTGATTQNLSGVSTGTYTLTVTDINGCSVVQSTTVTQPPSPLVATPSMTQSVGCYGASTGSANVVASGGTAPYTYSWSNGSTATSISGLTAGIYTITVADANGCTTLNSTSVTQPSAALTSSVNATQNINCFGGNNGYISLTVTGGTAPYTYNWTNGATTQDISNLASGAYIVTITDARGCTTTSTATLSQPAAALDAIATVSQNVFCFGGSNGAVNLTVTGGTSPFTYNWSNGATTQNLTGVTTGTYSVTVTDANGCIKTTSVTVTQPSAALSSSLTVSQNVSCFGGNNGAINTTVNGGTSPYTYVWSNGATSQNISGLTSGTFTVTITDANGCTTSKNTTITQPSAAISGSLVMSQAVSCHNGANGALNLTVNGGTVPYTYTWSNGATSQDISNVPAGTYTVTVTDANGCTLNFNSTITQPAASLAASASATANVSCFGGNNGVVSLSVSGGTAAYSYIWSNGSISQNLSGVASGTYNVTVTDANGCTANASATVTQPAAALSSSLAVTQNVSCFGGNNGSLNLSVSNGTAPYSYSWSNGATTQDISSLSNGTYTVTITDANGCTNIQSAIIAQPAAALSGSLVMSQAVSCFSGNNGALNLTVNGGTTPYAYQWSNGAVTQDISGAAAGTYTVTVTDANGCTLNYTATITQPAASLAASATTASNISCFGGNNGSVNLSVSGGTTPYSYNWSNGSSTQNLSGLSAGTYTVTITDANGCTATTSAVVTQPAAALSSSLAIVQNVSCFGGNNGSLNLTVNNGTAPYSYNWSNGATTQDISSLGSGTYTVTITDANGCTNLQSAAISQPSGALSASAVSSQNVSCFGGNNGSVNLTVTGGTTPYSYNWSNGLTTEDMGSLSSGTFTVTVTDANGCTSNATVTVTQPAAALSTTITSSQNVSCFSGNNGTVNLTVANGTAPYSYNWSNGATTQDLSGLGAGTYSVIVTDANGCTSTKSVTITQPAAALASSATIDQNVSCFGGNNGSVNLTVTGGTTPYSYNWSNGQTTQDLSGLGAGNYTVTVTDVNGCTTTRTITISQPAAALAATATQSQAVSCRSGNDGQISLAVSGGTAPYTYVWSNGATTQAINGLSAGTYSVTVTDANGCTTIASAVITQPSAVLSGSTTTTSNISCFSGNNGSIDLTVAGGTAPYTFMWSNGAITEDLTGLPAGSYSVTITDANGCVATSSGIITQPAGSLAANLNVSQNVNCFGGGNGSLDLTVTGGTAPYNYTWSTGATTEDISGLAVGFYTVSITDANGCISSATGAITQPSAALASSISTSQNVSCFGGGNGSLDLTVNGGTTPYSYNWSNGASSQDINNLASGTYTVSITDANGCTTVQTGTVSQPAAALAASATASANVSCFGGGNGVVNLTVNGGTVPYTYSWSNGASTEDLNGLSAGIYSVIINDANGCNTTATVTVTEPVAPVSITINSTQAVSCFGGNDGQAVITANGGTAPYTYIWNTGAVTSTITGLSTGTYTVTVTDNNGCSQTASVVLSQPVAPLTTLIAATQSVSCFGGSNGTADLVVTGGTAPYAYLWNTGATTQDAGGLSNGTYTVTVTDANNCTAIQTVSISQPAAALSATASASSNVSCYGGSNGVVDLNVNGGTAPYTYSWNNGQTTQDISGLSAGNYSVNVIDANGCTSTATVTVSEPVAAVSITINSTQAVSCFGGNNGQAIITANGGTGPYTYQWNTGTATAVINGLATGTYTVTVTDINGCSQSTAVTLSQPVAPLAASINASQNVSCFGGNDGTADVTVTGGTAPYTYVWNTGAATEDVSGLSNGTYTVTVTDANNCITSQTVTISQPAAALSGTAVVTANISCFSGNNGTIDLTATGGTNPYTFLWNTGSVTEDIGGLGAGMYTVTITDQNGCTATTNAEITQPAGSLAASLAVSQNVLCFAGNTGSLDLTVNGGTAPYLFVWNTGATTEDLSGLSSGIYTVNITDQNGCITSQSAFVNQPSAALSAMARAIQPVLCFAGSNGSIDLNISGGTAPYTYSWNNGATSEDLNNLTAGTYTVVITDANGCTFTLTEVISQPAAALASATSVTQNVLCNSGNDGSATVAVSGGTAPYYYAWNNGEITSAISNLSSGWYYVNITDDNGCAVSDSVEVTQPAAALASSLNASQNVNCFGGTNGSIDLNVSGGTLPYTFTWNNGETTEDISNLAAGTYTVNITDANGCTTSNTINISQPSAALSSVINGTINVSCFGGNNGNVNLDVTGGTAPYTYNWNNGAVTEDLSGLAAGIYSVTVTDANGCTSDASVTINEPSAALNAALTMAQQVNCFGGENGAIDLTVSGGTIPYTFTWSTGDTTQNISNLMAGTYVVIVTDANGCEEPAQLTLNQPVAPLLGFISVTSNVFCNGGSNGALDLNINGGTVPYTFLWSNGETTEDIGNLATGTYTVTVTDANGCSTTITEGIGQPNQQLGAAVTIQQVLCFNGNNGLIDITPAGGTAPYAFIWSTGSVSEDIGSLFAGTYTVTITDANGCDTTITATVSQPAAPLIPALTIAQNVSCFGGNDGSITLAVTGGTPPYVYLWNTGATTSNISNLTSGAYTVTVTDANGCNAIISDFVAQPARSLDVPLNVTQQVSCFGGSDGSITSNATGGTAPYSYLWNTGATTSGLTGLQTGTYTVTVTDSKGCTFSATAQVSQPNAPLAVTGSATIANCLNGQGGAITIQVTGGTPMYSFLWSNGATTQNLSNAMPGSYTVTVTDANGCSVSGTYTVENNSDFNLNAGPTTICVGETVTLVADSIPGGVYQWYFEGSPLNGATGLTFITPAAGYYFVTATVPCGTFFSDSIEVIVKSIENASITSNQVICPPEMVQLHATGGVTYQWSPTTFMTFPTAPDPIVFPPATTTYSVLVTNEWGCTTTMSVEIAVACDTLFVPNGFSPNDDGTNDGYVIDGIENYPGNKLWVYNRWGNLVYKTKDYKNNWDGVSNVSGIYMGHKVPSGTYYFILDLNDYSKPRAGYLIIRR